MSDLTVYGFRSWGESGRLLGRNPGRRRRVSFPPVSAELSRDCLVHVSNGRVRNGGLQRVTAVLGLVFENRVRPRRGSEARRGPTGAASRTAGEQIRILRATHRGTGDFT